MKIKYFKHVRKDIPYSKKKIYVLWRHNYLYTALEMFEGDQNEVIESSMWSLSDPKERELAIDECREIFRQLKIPPGQTLWVQDWTV